MSKAANAFRYFSLSPEVIRLVVMMYIRFSRSPRNVDDRLFERIYHETVPVLKEPLRSNIRRRLQLALAVSMVIA